MDYQYVYLSIYDRTVTRICKQITKLVSKYHAVTETEHMIYVIST